MSDAYMSTKDIIDKEEQAYTLFSNQPPKDILDILNLHDDDALSKRQSTSSRNENIFMKEKPLGFIRNFSID